MIKEEFKCNGYKATVLVSRKFKRQMGVKKRDFSMHSIRRNKNFFPRVMRAYIMKSAIYTEAMCGAAALTFGK